MMQRQKRNQSEKEDETEGQQQEDNTRDKHKSQRGRKRDKEMRNRSNAATWMRKGRRNDTEPTLLQALCDRGGDDGNDWLSYLQSDPVMMSPLVGGVEGCLCLTVNCRPRNQEGDDNANIFRRNALVTAGL